MDLVAVPAPAQVAPERVDTLVLAPAVVLGTLVLVWGDQRTLLRGTANLGWSLLTQNPDEKYPPLGSLPSLGMGEGSFCCRLYGPGIYQTPHAPKAL